MSVFVRADAWLNAILFGSAATMTAIIFVAALGLAMIGGRIEVGRAARLLFGCALLFGAPAIGAALVGFESPSPGEAAAGLAATPIKLPAGDIGPYDPYAGASVPQNR